ncbi:interleukin-20 receptor subunit alpha [Labrus mixtus]|uniref:interleukin-20 receptor subunit alpha n=1 Tax=Labrus mixtus TaxID=508554 RepID=UPI0029C04057|nr:interleukin-20 receptor subunit alpha [Labrus mixtus]
MWTVFIFLNLGALYCTVSCFPPSPTNVFFSSVNLRNLLQWSPGNGTKNDTLYTVQYAIYGDSVEGSKGKRVHWRSAWHCREVGRHWCDLSNETWDLEQGYHARVQAKSRRAFSKWATTWRRFDPKSDTIFGPPLVSVDMEGNNAIITVKGPMRYQLNNQTPAVSMATLYAQMTYNLSVHNIRRGRMSNFPFDSSHYKYRLMDYDTEYCFSAKTRFLSMPVHCQPSEWNCITTPPDPLIAKLLMVVVGIVVPTVCICLLVVIGYFLYQYLTGKGQKSPYILNPPSFYPPPLTFSPEAQSVVLFKVGLPSEPENGISDPTYSKKQPHIAEPPPGYAPQGSDTPLEPEEPWDHLSIDYGFVGKAADDGGINGNNHRDESQNCVAVECNDEKGWKAEDQHSTTAYASQAKSYLSQKSTKSCSETHMPIQARTEVSTLAQAHACLQVNSVLLYQSSAQSSVLQGAVELDKEEEEDEEFSGLFINKTPQTGLFSIPLHVKSKKNDRIVENMAKVQTNVKNNEGKEEGRSEREPLLSAYASQNIINMPTSQSDQSHYLPDDYGVLSMAAAHRSEDDEEEGGTICIEWDPETGKLALPEVGMEFQKEAGLMQRENGRESKAEGEAEEEVSVREAGLRLENVFVRQGSEEKAEAQREKETGGELGWETDNLLSKWNLVISLNE